MFIFVQVQEKEKF